MEWADVLLLLIGGGLTIVGGFVAGWVTHHFASKRDAANRQSDLERDRLAHQREREERLRGKKEHAYAEFLGSLRSASLTYAKSYEQGIAADVDQAISELHLRRSWVDLVASPGVREAVDDVSRAMDRFHTSLEGIRAQAEEGDPPPSDEVVAEWDSIVRKPVNRLAEAMRKDILPP